MPIKECSAKEWFDDIRKEEASIRQATQGLKIKRCPECKTNAYSYDPTFQTDPGCCASCGGREGDLRL